VVDGVEGCRNIKEAETGDLLMRDGRNKLRKVSVECRLVKPDWCGFRSELEVM